MVVRHLRAMEKKNLVLLTAAVAIVFGLVFGYILTTVAISNSWDLPFLPMSKPSVGVQTSAANFTPKVEQYLTANFLKSYGAEAKVTNTSVVGGLTVMGVDIVQNGTTLSSGEVYVSSDGDLVLLGTLYNMSKPVPVANQTQNQTQTATTQAPKTDKPDVSLYVMAFCPYGQQAEGGMWPVLDLMKDKINFELHYVVYSSDYYKGQEAQYCLNNTYCSMHGVGEINEDMRQKCIMQSYNSSVWLGYVKEINSKCSAQNVDTCWEGVAQAAGIDTAAVKSCFNSSATSLAVSEQALNTKNGVQGSPTMFINGVEYQGGRTADAYKTAICNAFNNAPSECSQTLNATASTASGSCG
jgi:protein-disulfide isomerase